MKKITMTKSKLICLLISLAASLILWTYVVTVVNTEMTETFYRVPVVFSGEDTLAECGLTITDGANSTITLQVTSSRSVIQQLSSENITVTVDVSKITAAGEFERGYVINYPNSVQPSNVSVNRKSPALISFTVEKLVSAEIPVKTVFEGSVKDGYILESLTTNYNSITITGTKEQVEEVSHALIIVGDEEISSSISRNMNYTMMDQDNEPVDMTGVGVDVEKIKVAVNVVKYKEVPLVVEFTKGGGATEENVDWKVNPSTITISGDEAALDDINKIVLNTLDMSTLMEDTTQSYPIVLPDGIKNESGQAEATVTIALSGLSTTTLRVSNFEFSNVPEGFDANAVTKALSVTVRGPSNSISAVRNSDIRIEIDLGNISGVAGTYTVDNVDVYLDGVEDIGVLGDYSITIALVESETETLEPKNESTAETEP